MSTAAVAERLKSIWETPRTPWGKLATVDHKEIGKRYLITAIVFLIIGGLEALALRIQLFRPNEAFLSPEMYDQLFSMHGITMIFWYALPILSGFAVYIIPLMIGSRDMAFPRLMSTANVFAASQPGQSLYSLATSDPPNPKAAIGDPESYGTPNDPMIGKAVGGIIVFGGGLPLYNGEGKIVGGLGLSGDTSCTDHIVAWKVRHQLDLDHVPMEPSPDHNDNMILDYKNGFSPSGFGHPACKGGMASEYMIENLSRQFPTGAKMK